MVRPAVAMHKPMPPVRAEVDIFTYMADAWLTASPSLFVLDTCSWCASTMHKLDRNNCCPTCGGPRE